MGDFVSNHSRCRKEGTSKITDRNGKERDICSVHKKQTDDHMAKFEDYLECYGCNRSFYDDENWLEHYSKYKASKKATNPNYVKKSRNR